VRHEFGVALDENAFGHMGIPPLPTQAADTSIIARKRRIRNMFRNILSGTSN
jgi:hypothetical protein